MSAPLIGSNSLQSAQIYRLVGPSVVADASATTLQVNANTKFNTNLPFDRYMLITRILYFMTWTKVPIPDVTSQVGSWTIFAQLTEALARTVPTTTDPVFVDEWTIVKEPGYTITAVGTVKGPPPYPGLIDRVLYNPWATAAQQLNQIVSVQPNNVTQNGPNVSIAPVIEYQLLPLSSDIRLYLATRVQIGGQA